MIIVRWCLLTLLVSVAPVKIGLTVTQQLDNPQPESLWTRVKGKDWPTFLGSTGDGKSVETGILKDWSKGKLKVVWKTNTGQGYGMGSVANGRFYHFGRLNDKANLRCFNAETGAPIWEFSYASEYRDLYGYDSGPRASPIIDEGLVYIYGVEGMLHCLDAKTGETVWKLNPSESFGVIQNFFGVASTPVIFEDLLIVMVGGSPDESKKVPPGALNLVKPNQSGLIALDKKTGQLKYKCVDDLASYCSLKLTSLGGQPALLAWMRESLFAVSPKSGKIAFEFPWRARMLESVNASMPVVHNGNVLISECYGKGSALVDPGQLQSVKGKSTPKLLWSDAFKRDKAMEAHWNTPIVIGDCFYGCSGRHPAPAELRCVDWKSGDVRWKKKGLLRSSLTYIDGHFIVLGEQGKLVLIEATSDRFKLVTQYEPGVGENGVKFKMPCWAAPIVSHGLLYVRGKDQLVCFELIPESN